MRHKKTTAVAIAQPNNLLPPAISLALKKIENKNLRHKIENPIKKKKNPWK